MERYSETKRRKAANEVNEDDAEIEFKPRRRRRSEPLVEFLKEKAKSERELREQELDLRRREQEQSQNVIQSVLQQQH